MTSEVDEGKTQTKTSKKIAQLNKEGQTRMTECGRRFLVGFLFYLVIVFGVSASPERSGKEHLAHLPIASGSHSGSLRKAKARGFGEQQQQLHHSSRMEVEEERDVGPMGSNVVDTLNKALEDASNKVPIERMLVHSGEAHLTAPHKKGDVVATQIEDIIMSKGGYLENKSSGHGSLSLTVRIPSNQFHEFLSKLNELGSVTDLSIRSKDVTDSFVDASSRASTLQASIKSLQALMTRANSVDEVLKVQKELNRLTQDYESQRARADSLQKQASLSTLNIYISEEYQHEVKEDHYWWWDLVSSVMTTFLEACRDVSEVFALLANALVYQSVVFVSIAIPVWLCYLAYRACCRVHLQRGWTKFSTFMSNQ